MVSKIIQNIKQRFTDPFWKNVATLFTGSAVAQALPIAFLPVITRLYSKEAIGFYFVYAAIGMLTQIVASFQYQMAIVLPKKEDDADTLLSLNIILSVLTSAILALGIFIFFDFISSYIEQKIFIKWLYLIPASTLFLGVFNAVSYYLTRQKEYTAISVGKVSKAITFTVLQLGFVFVGFLNSGLILGLVGGQFLSMVVLLFFVFRKTDYKWKTDFVHLKSLLIKYKDIPLFNTFILFLNTLSNQMPLFFLTRWFGAESAGDYGLANRIVTTPMGLFGESVGQVFFKEGADIHNRGESLKNLVKTTYLRMIKIGIVPFILFGILAPWLFRIIFGSGYGSSGEITQVLIPWLFLLFLNSPLSYVITILNKQRILVYYSIFQMLFRLAAFFVGYYVYHDMMLTIIFYSAVGFVFNIFFFFYVVSLSKRENVVTYS